MFGKRKTTNTSNTSNMQNVSNEESKNAYNSDMTSGSRSTKSESTKSTTSNQNNKNHSKILSFLTTTKNAIAILTKIRAKSQCLYASYNSKIIKPQHTPIKMPVHTDTLRPTLNYFTPITNTTQGAT